MKKVIAHLENGTQITKEVSDSFDINNESDLDTLSEQISSDEGYCVESFSH